MTKSLKASLRKGIVGIVMMTTIFSLSGVVALIPVAQAATIVDGDVIRNPSAAGDAQFDVYIVKLMGANKYKRLVLNPAVFESYGHLKWENVKLVTSEEMNLYKTSAMVRVETDPKVYALAPNGDTGSKSWLNVAAETYVAAGGAWDQVYTINAVDAANYAVATDLTTQAQVVTFLTTGALPGVVTPGAVTVALSADTPASTTVITTQAAADFLHFTLTGTGTVTGVALKRTGISADASLSNVYLFDGATRLTDAASVSSGSVINFTNSSGLFTVSGSRTISVKSDLAATAGETIAVQLTGVTMTSGVVGGTLPITGNTMSVATATLAGAAFGAVTPSTTTINPTNDVVVWQSTLTVTTRDINLTRVAFREIGSINYADVNNFRLYVDGVQVAQTQSLDANGYVTFSLATAKTITTGARVVKVIADVISGSSRTLSFSLRNKADIGLLDSNYGVGVSVSSTLPATAGTLTVASGSLSVQKTTDTPSGNVTLNGSDIPLAKYTFTAFGEPVKVETLSTAFTYTNAGYTAQVSTATLTGTAGTAAVTIAGTTVSTAFATDLTTTAANLVTAINANATVSPVVTATSALAVVTITKDAVSGVSGAFTIVNASSGGMTATVATTTTGVGTYNAATTLRNGRIMLNGAQVGSTTTLAAASTAFTTNFVVTPGTPVAIEVRSDIYDNDGAGVLNASDTIVASLLIGASNGQGQVSSTTLNVPTATTAASTVTVATGSVSLAKQTNYASQNTVVPKTAYKLAAYNLTGNSTEDVNIDTISVDFSAVATFTAADLTNVYIMYGGVKESSTKATVTTSANTWGVSHVLAKNTSTALEIYADIGPSTGITAADSIAATTTVTGTTASSAQSATTGAVAGQTIAYVAGSVSATKDSSSIATSMIDDNQTLVAAVYKFTAVNDAYTVTDITITTPAATTLQTIALKDGATVLATKPAAASVTFSGLSIVVPANTTSGKVIGVELAVGNVGTGAGTSGENVTVTLSSYTTNSTIGTTVGATIVTGAGNTLYAYKAIPTITNVALPTTTLSTGTPTLAKFTISAGSTGTIGWKEIVLNITKTARATTGPIITVPVLYDSNGIVVPTSTATVTNGAAADAVATITFVTTNEEEISGSKTYVVKANVAVSTLTSGDNINTNIASSGLGYVAPATYTTVAATAETFAWTDQSLVSHDTTTTLDWNNDNLVKNIPTDAQTLSY